MNKAEVKVDAPIPSILKQRTFERRELISQEDKILWQIERGIVRATTWDEDGACMTLGYWGVGDIMMKPSWGVSTNFRALG